MIEFLLSPFQYEFMQHGLLAAIIVGILCSVLGCYVVLRSMAFLGDALAHAILPGVAIAYLFGGNLTIGAVCAAVVASIGIGVISRKGTIKEDTAIGIIFTASLALGIALISTIRSYAVDLTHILFGNVLGVGIEDLYLMVILGVIIIGVVIICYKQFLVISFDPILAETLRLPVKVLQNLLLILLALTIVISIQTVGVGLSAAMLVTPAATAYLITKRLSIMMLFSSVLGCFSSICGLYLSYYANISSGAAIVLVATGVFVVLFLFSPEKGLITQRFFLKRLRNSGGNCSESNDHQA